MQSENLPGCWTSLSKMPTRSRVVVPGVACRVTQRGTYRQQTFFNDEERRLSGGVKGQPDPILMQNFQAGRIASSRQPFGSTCPVFRPIIELAFRFACCRRQDNTLASEQVESRHEQ
jgi:hypothetical protein